MKIDSALVAAALADVERIQEDLPGLDPSGIGASTLRLVVDAIGGRIKQEHPRFHTGEFQIASLPSSSERQRQAIVAKLGTQ